MKPPTIPASIEPLRETVRAAGEMALQAQQRFEFSDRELKGDGSILTKVDRQVEAFLLGEIGARFPRANLLAEETAHAFDPRRPYTFAIDPIDGTDSFSQGMPGWCVAVGLLDHDLTPIAGLVYSPRWDAFFYTDVHGPATCNGRPLTLPAPALPLNQRTNLFVHSSIHRKNDLSGYRGKIRNVGSTALQICLPLLYPAVVGTISGRAWIWDLAGAHAILQAGGGVMEYMNGSPLVYGPLAAGEQARDQVLSGSRQGVDAIRAAFSS